jgi:hypothetical protein
MMNLLDRLCQLQTQGARAKRVPRMLGSFSVDVRVILG